MTKVRLKVSRVTQHESQGLGSIVDVPEDEALALIDAGQAELVGPLPDVEPLQNLPAANPAPPPPDAGRVEQEGAEKSPELSPAPQPKVWTKPR